MRLAALALLLLLPSAQASKWNLVFQHDKDDSSLFLRGLEFPTDQRGIAIGILTEKNRPRSVTLTTADGGNSWVEARFKEEPMAINCHSGSCWIATEKGVWRSDEAGLDWKKVSKQKGILKLHFASPNQGWAVGPEKSAWETKDGGVTWTLLPVLAEVKSNPQWTTFLAMGFQGPFGLIGGNSRSPRRDRSIYPDWMVPDDVARRREWPGMMILLETRDGGGKWTSGTTSVFGTLTNLRMRPDGSGAAVLLEYFDTFETPSEVLSINFRTGRSESIYREKNTAITDILWTAADNIIVAGVEANGLRSLPIPQKARFLEATFSPGTSAVVWTKMDVDYRVTGRRLLMSRKPNGQIWAVTDSGMVLRLDR